MPTELNCDVSVPSETKILCRCYCMGRKFFLIDNTCSKHCNKKLLLKVRCVHLKIIFVNGPSFNEKFGILRLARGCRST